MAFFTMIRSIHGRALGLSSTAGLLIGNGTSTAGLACGTAATRW